MDISCHFTDDAFTRRLGRRAGSDNVHISAAGAYVGYCGNEVCSEETGDDGTSKHCAETGEERGTVAVEDDVEDVGGERVLDDRDGGLYLLELECVVTGLQGTPISFI